VSISKIRTFLYKTAKYLGDFNALKRAYKSGNFKPIMNRIIRRIYGYITGRGMPKL
jgi:hypothetical protein